ncbi:MAG: DnaD domain protein [Clostridiales bacterium]|nr:DnaD domain protein [Clostridiales bacterium]
MAYFIMNYQIAPVGGIWNGGMFSVPKAVAENYIRLASEYQIKALLIILSGGGVASSAEISKKLGITGTDARNIMDFWIAEGIVFVSDGSCDTDETGILEKTEKTEDNDINKTQKTEKIQTAQKDFKITAPTLTPKEIVEIAGENPEIQELLNEAQRFYGRTISHSEQEMLVNLISFYGMKFEVILMLLGYCAKEKARGKAISSGYFYKIAENWIDEGVETVSDAEEKLKELEKSDELWNVIKNMAELKKNNPTVLQRNIILDWKKNFSMEVISLAIDEMKENIDTPNLRYVDKILKNWKKSGVKTAKDVEKSKAEFEKQKERKENKETGKISRKPTYDINKIKKDTLNNTDIKY